MHDSVAPSKEMPRQSVIWITGAAIFALALTLAFVLLTRVDGFIGTDDYYHSRIAAQIIEQGSLRLNFPWLPMTILSNDQFVDHHLLYHLYVAPFMAIGGITGAKLAQSIVFGSIAVAFWSLLRTVKVRHAWLWSVGIVAVSAPFLYRMLMIRTQGAAVLLLLITLNILFQRRYLWLILLAFAFTWLYNGFVLLPAIVGLYALAVWITERRILWRPVMYAFAGVVLGLVINPYFPQNMAFIIDHLGEKVDIGSNVRVGNEWYPYTTGELMENSLGALLALVAGILAGSFRKSGRDHIETAVLLVALLTLYMVFRSRRFIEYYPIFALLFCAVAWGRSPVSWRNVLPDWMPSLVYRRVYTLIIALPIGVLSLFIVGQVHDDIQHVTDFDYMRGASVWLMENTEPGEMVFQTDWDDFTRLFFHNTHNTYLVGLDPTYLQVANPVLWNQWVAITQGLVDRPSVLIQEMFDAKYVVSDNNHEAFSQDAESDPAMQLVYQDEYSLIWLIHEASP
ncbi:MAG: hypothetical protein KC708_24235 [Anaerolineae bacterium]|nr:hypothetical protein [Anaerolineae bacterium]